MCHDHAVMHCRAAERADLLLHNYDNPSERINARLMKDREQQASENKHVLRQIILAVEFLAKQGLSFRGHHDNKVDFPWKMSTGAISLLLCSFMAIGDSFLKKHLLSAKLKCTKSGKG